jgi:membrane protein required for colicin V production
MNEKAGDGAARAGYTRHGAGSARGETRQIQRANRNNMPITLLDVGLIAVMLISGLLAMIRGFMREVLSITAWVLAAGATLYAYGKLLPAATAYFNSDLIAKGVVVGGVFLVTLLVVSVVTVRISDMVLDSRVGALDRTLGFLFGLGRGLIIVVVAFGFFDWLVPAKAQPGWITDAKSKVFLANTADWLRSMSPDLEALYQKYRGNKGDEREPDETPNQHGAVNAPADPAGA